MVLPVIVRRPQKFSIAADRDVRDGLRRSMPRLCREPEFVVASDAARPLHVVNDDAIDLTLGGCHLALRRIESTIPNAALIRGDPGPTACLMRTAGRVSIRFDVWLRFSGATRPRRARAP